MVENFLLLRKAKDFLFSSWILVVKVIGIRYRLQQPIGAFQLCSDLVIAQLRTTEYALFVPTICSVSVPNH